MIIMQKRQSGNIDVVAAGKVKTDARYFDASGKHKTTFYLNVEKGNDICCHAWGKTLAYLASCFEKGDIVFVAGVWKKDEYRTQKEGKDCFFVECQYINPQQEAVFAEDQEETEGGQDE